MKRLFRAAGLPIVHHATIMRTDWERDQLKITEEVESKLRYPVFVKPANLGSSVGITKVHNHSELGSAIDIAAEYDRKIIIEEGVGGKKYKARELECAVLGNDDPQASIVGEVIPSGEFYDYRSKYLDEGSQLLIPANISQQHIRQVQQISIRAFQAVDCCGLARVDFLMHPTSKKIYINEINTMPGFTAISMYPKLWGASGLDYPSLIERLVQLAIERHKDKKRNRYSRI